jgi:HK97 family phage major capsid protein
MAMGTDSLGGFLVPEEFRADILSAALERGIVRPRALQQPMSTDKLNIPVLVDSSRATAIYGGITCQYPAEGDDLAGTMVAPKIGQVGLSTKDLVAFAYLSNALAADAPNFEQFMKTAFGKALAFYEDVDFIWGPGGARPLGIMNATATVSVTRAANGALGWADLRKMAGRLLPGSWATAVFLVSPDALVALYAVTLASTVAGFHVDTGRLFMGIPIIVTEKCSALGTTGDVILADFQGYVIGDRSMVIAASAETSYSSGSYGWLQNQTAWKIWQRYDGQPILSAAITPYKGANSLSHFVTLSTSS